MAGENTGCCAPLRILTRLTFRDGTQAAVVGLQEILAAMYAEGRKANEETAEEIVERVAATSYVPSSGRGEYRDVLLQEYKRYVVARQSST
jgi:hypothetical protein